MRALTLSALLLTTAAAIAQAPAPKATVTFDKPSAVPGSVVKATLKLEFAEGLHGYQNPPADEYQIPVSVKLLDKGFALVVAKYPKGNDFTMAGETKPTKVYEGTISIPLEIKTNAKAGTYNVSVRVDYQQCNESSCFPPGSVVAKAKLVIAKPGKKG